MRTGGRALHHVAIRDLAANATDPQQVLALDARLQDVLAEKDQVEAEWLEAAEAAEG